MEKMHNEVLKEIFTFNLKGRLMHSRASIASFLTVVSAPRIPCLPRWLTDKLIEWRRHDHRAPPLKKHEPSFWELLLFTGVRGVGWGGGEVTTPKQKQHSKRPELSTSRDSRKRKGSTRRLLPNGNLGTAATGQNGTWHWDTPLQGLSTRPRSLSDPQAPRHPRAARLTPFSVFCWNFFVSGITSVWSSSFYYMAPQHSDFSVTIAFQIPSASIKL